MQGKIVSSDTIRKTIDTCITKYKEHDIKKAVGYYKIALNSYNKNSTQFGDKWEDKNAIAAKLEEVDATGLITQITTACIKKYEEHNINDAIDFYNISVDLNKAVMRHYGVNWEHKHSIISQFKKIENSLQMFVISEDKSGNKEVADEYRKELLRVIEGNRVVEGNPRIQRTNSSVSSKSNSPRDYSPRNYGLSIDYNENSSPRIVTENKTSTTLQEALPPFSQLHEKFKPALSKAVSPTSSSGSENNSPRLVPPPRISSFLSGNAETQAESTVNELAQRRSIDTSAMPLAVIAQITGTEETAEDVNKLSLANLIETGKDFLRNGKYKMACTFFEAGLAQQPENLHVLSYMTIALENLELHKEALPYYDRIIKIEPNNILAICRKEACVNHTQDISSSSAIVNPSYVEKTLSLRRLTLPPTSSSIVQSPRRGSFVEVLTNTNAPQASTEENKTPEKTGRNY